MQARDVARVSCEYGVGMRGGVNTAVAGPADEEMNLGSVGRAIWRNKRSIIGPTLIMAAAAFVAVNLMTPRYKSEARVLVEGRENIFLRPEADKSLIDRGTIDAETVTSQVQLILSRDLAREVIKDLNLTESPEFNAALKEFSPLSILAHHRHPQGSDVDDARGAGAGRLLRPADSVRDRQVARHHHRVPVGRSGAGRRAAPT